MPFCCMTSHGLKPLLRATRMDKEPLAVHFLPTGRRAVGFYTVRFANVNEPGTAMQRNYLYPLGVWELVEKGGEDRVCSAYL